VLFILCTSKGCAQQTTKQSLAQLFILSHHLLSMKCFPLKVSLWNSESRVLYFPSFHTSAKFQDWLWCVSKVAWHPAVIIPWICLTLWNCDLIITAPREKASCTWNHDNVCPSTASCGSWVMLMSTGNIIWRGYSHMFWNHASYVATLPLSHRPLTFWSLILNIGYNDSQS
jgi:hypothetical protein